MIVVPQPTFLLNPLKAIHFFQILPLYSNISLPSCKILRLILFFIKTETNKNCAQCMA